MDWISLMGICVVGDCRFQTLITPSRSMNTVLLMVVVILESALAYYFDMLSVFVAAVALADHPYQLTFKGDAMVAVGSGLTRTSDGKAVELDAIVAAAKGKKFVLVGEQHETAAHHTMQAQIADALAKSGRKVTIGFEMFTRDNQGALDAWWKDGWKQAWDEPKFVQSVNWKTQWGFDFGAYRPIFEVARRDKMRLIALNVPRDWVREIGREGPSTVTEERKKWVPHLDLGNANHRAIFSALMGGHPPTGARGENIYAAQVSWDTGMALAAKEAMAGTGDDEVMVIAAGIGHVMYGECISYRLRKMGVDSSLDVVCITEVPEGGVAKSIGEFVFVGG